MTNLSHREREFPSALVSASPYHERLGLADLSEGVAMGNQRFPTFQGSFRTIYNLVHPSISSNISSDRHQPEILIFDCNDSAQFSFEDILRQGVFQASNPLTEQFQRRLAELVNMQPNWDNEGAKAIKSSVLADAVEAVKRLKNKISNFREPFLVPTVEGFVQLEWHDSRKSLEMEAIDGGWSVVGIQLLDNGKRDYSVADCNRSDFAGLADFYRWFNGDEMIWPSR